MKTIKDSTYRLSVQIFAFKTQVYYRKVIDARGSNNSGGKSFNLKFFEELHQIFRKCHGNILPVAQSSLRKKKYIRRPPAFKAALQRKNLKPKRL